MIPFRWLPPLLVLLGVGCSPVAEPQAGRTTPREVPAARQPDGLKPGAAMEVVSQPVAAHPAVAARRIATNVGGVPFEGVEFDSRTHRLEVVDQARGPASQWADSQAAGSANGGLAAINAGFFTPEGSPLGLVVTRGTVRGGWNGASSLGSGLWFEEKSGRSAIARREKVGSTAARGMKELLQAGPMLVEAKAAVGGLDAVKSSPRTVLLWDGGTRWVMAHMESCSLADAARILAASSPAGWPVVTALNLDGGRSAELWTSNKIPGGGALIRPFWNKPVRNYLVLKSR